MENNVQETAKEVVKYKTVYDDVGMGNWFLTILLTCIPVVNIVWVIFCLFDRKKNPSKSNFFIAVLLWAVIVLILSAVMLGV